MFPDLHLTAESRFIFKSTNLITAEPPLIAQLTTQRGFLHVSGKKTNNLKPMHTKSKELNVKVFYALSEVTTATVNLPAVDEKFPSGVVVGECL